MQQQQQSPLHYKYQNTSQNESSGESCKVDTWYTQQTQDTQSKQRTTEFRTPLSQRKINQVYALSHDPKQVVYVSQNHNYPKLDDQMVRRSDVAALQWLQWAQNEISNEQQQVNEPKEHSSGKAKSAFKLFKLDNIVQVKADHPNYGFKERLTLMKDLWRELPKPQKYQYVMQSRKQKESQFTENNNIDEC